MFDEVDIFCNLRHEELRIAEIYWLKYVQQSFSTCEETYLKKLCPYIDEMGIKRACGRLKKF